MNYSKSEMMLLNLQLFAEGAGGSAGSSGVSASAQTAAAGSSSGEKDQSTSVATEGAEEARVAAEQGRRTHGQTTTSSAFAAEATQHETNMMQNAEGGNQEEQKASGDDRRAAYAKLKAEYQDLFDAEMQGIVRERLRKPNAKVKEMMPLMDKLAVRYGTEPGDLKALTAAVDADKLYLAAKAEETGTTEEIQAELEKYRTRETTERREAREVEAARRGAELTAQAKAVKEAYPTFNVQAELKNPQFVKLMDAGLDMRTAYEVAHRKELQQAQARYVAGQAARGAAQKAEDNVVASIKANGMRPAENAAKGAAPAQAKVDPAKLTSEQINDYLRRAKNGERITF